MTATVKKPHSKTAAPEAAAVAPTDSTASAPSTAPAPDTPLPTQRQPNDRQAIVGIQRNLTGHSSITLAGKQYTPASLVTLFQARVNAADTTDQSERTWHDDVATERETEEALAPVRKAFRAFLIGTYGGSSKKLKEFGVTPLANRKKPSAATLADAAEAAKATRVARGPTGKRQRAKVKATTPEPEPPVNAVANGAPVATNGAANANAGPGK